MAAALAEGSLDEVLAEQEGDFDADTRWALAWFEEGGGKPESYVNLIPTVAGGTHEAGLKAGVFEAIKTFAEHHAILPAKRCIASRRSIAFASF